MQQLWSDFLFDLGAPGGPSAAAVVHKIGFRHTTSFNCALPNMDIASSRCESGSTADESLSSDFWVQDNQEYDDEIVRPRQTYVQRKKRIRRNLAADTDPHAGTGRMTIYGTLDNDTKKWKSPNSWKPGGYHMPSHNAPSNLRMLPEAEQGRPSKDPLQEMVSKVTGVKGKRWYMPQPVKTFISGGAKMEQAARMVLSVIPMNGKYDLTGMQ